MLLLMAGDKKVIEAVLQDYKKSLKADPVIIDIDGTYLIVSYST